MRASSRFTSQYRHGQCAFRTPSGRYAAIDSFNVDMVDARPFVGSAVLSERLQPHVITSVIRLFFTGCPPYVARLIMTVYINTIQRMLWRRSPAKTLQKVHVGVKAKCDSTPAIVTIGGVTGILTSVAGVAITAIFRRVLIRFAVYQFAFYHNLAFKTSARLGSAVNDRGAANDARLSALTLTEPPSVAVIGKPVNETNNGEPSELESRQILKIEMGWDRVANWFRIGIRHFNLLDRLNCLEGLPV